MRQNGFGHLVLGLKNSVLVRYEQKPIAENPFTIGFLVWVTGIEPATF